MTPSDSRFLLYIALWFSNRFSKRHFPPGRGDGVGVHGCEIHNRGLRLLFTVQRVAARVAMVPMTPCSPPAGKAPFERSEASDQLARFFSSTLQKLGFG
jgi:hypothetical protein